MPKLFMSVLAGATVAAGLAMPAPAKAQSGTTGEVIVYGNDACPRAADDDIVVCRRLPEESRYRIPEPLRPTGPRQAGEAWANRARALERAGATGINSCSAVGPGGFTGCLTEQIQQAQEEHREAEDAGTAPEQ